jgi:hypothetical protein
MTWLDRPCNICGAETLRDGHYAYAIKIGGDGIPETLLACRVCIPHAPAASNSTWSKYENIQNRCVYCGTDCDGRFCSDRCAKMHTNEQRPLDPLSPVSILVNDLRSISKANPVPATAQPEHKPREMMSGAAMAAAKSAKARARADALDMHAGEIDPFIPTNEMGVVFMFGTVADRIGWRMAYLDGKYPDGVIVNKSGQKVKIEFEFDASSFVHHGHDPEFCDVVVCWNHDRQLSKPVLALSKYYNTQTGAWDFGGFSLSATTSP